MPEWTLTYTGFNPAEERLREALCTLGNGYFFTRGAAPESRADGIHYPGTYIAGGYSRLEVVAKPRAIMIARESAEDGEVMIGYLDERYALMPGGTLNIDLPEPD